MPSPTDGSGWDETLPANNEPASLGAQEIRTHRIQYRIRQNKEHTPLGGSSAGGEHKQGSAKVYVQGSAPTLRPDGVTALNADDAGRLWFNNTGPNSREMQVWDGTQFVGLLLTSAGNLADGIVGTNKLANNAVDTAKINAAAVTEPKIAVDAVTASKIASGAVTEPKIGAGAVTDEKIASGAVTEPKIGGGAVTEPKIASGAVTEPKIANSAVITSKIANLAVTESKLADTSVTAAKIANSAVTYFALAENLRVRYFLYTGNGSSSGPVIGGIGVLSIPKVVLIMGHTGTPGLWYGTVGNTTAYRADGADSVASALEWNAANITITTANNKINQNGMVFTAIVFS